MVGDGINDSPALAAADVGMAIGAGTEEVNTAIFDKTGTLTVGKPAVVNTMLFSKISLQELFDLAATAELNNEHPLAKAVVEHKKKLHHQYGSPYDHTVEATEFEVHPGVGVSAKAGNKTVLVGNKRLMLDFGARIHI